MAGRLAATVVVLAMLLNGPAADIRARGLTTYVPEFCFSACTMLFQAGTSRIIGVEGSLMFHPSRPPNAEFDYWVGRIYAR